MTTEGNLLRRVMLKLSALGCVPWRNNSGMAWIGEKVREDHFRGLITLRNARPVRFGVGIGGSDCIGWKSVVVTPDMVGQRIAVFMAIETKGHARTRVTDEQRRFVQTVREAGGIGAIVRSEEEAEQAVVRGTGMFGARSADAR